jgi:hypothetical protein
MIVQQPNGDDSPGIADVPGHVVVDSVGAGTAISGLRPGAVAAEGVVASLKFGVATVLEGASIGAALPTKELVSVVSVLLAREAASIVVVAGLHVPAIVDIPNGDVIGSGATEGVKLTEGLGVTEEKDEDATPALVIAVLLPLAVVELVVPVMGHTTIPPSEFPGIGPKLPVYRKMVPSEFPVAPTVGIVPGATVGDMVGIMVDDRAGVPGVRGVLADLV